MNPLLDVTPTLVNQSLVSSLWHTFSHVETHVDLNFSILIGIFIVLNMFYYIFDWLFNSNYSNTYSSLNFDRKRYVIKNILKAVYLGILSVYSSYAVLTFLFTNVWSNYIIHNLGFMYMLPDLISLFRVPGMHRTTIQHHVTVVILTTLNMFCDYSADTYWRGMVIYAYMSILTGIVNFYLGYRLLTTDKTLLQNIARGAFINYLISIIINWSYQLYIVGKWAFTDFPLWGMYIYIALIYFVVVDDIVLLSFLHHAMKDRTDGTDRSDGTDRTNGTDGNEQVESKWKDVMQELNQVTTVKKDISVMDNYKTVLQDIKKESN